MASNTPAEPVPKESSAPEMAPEDASTMSVVADHQPSLAEVVAATVTSATDSAPDPPLAEPEAASTTKYPEVQALSIPESGTAMRVDSPHIGAAEDEADGTADNEATSVEPVSEGGANAPDASAEQGSRAHNLDGLTVSHPESDPTIIIINPPGHVAPDANGEDVSAPIPGPVPWEILGKDRLPPLLQGMAPRFPLHEGGDELQKERQHWRESWKLYARSVYYVANHMRVQLLLAGFDDQSVLEAYIDIQKSINEDMLEVMRQNSDVGDRNRNFNKFPRRTHSYLAWSEKILRQHQTDLENCLGSSENKKWGIGGGTKLKFGQLYPDDDFREVLHFRPQSEVAKPERVWPDLLPAAFPIGLLLLVLGWLHYEFDLPSVFWHSVCWLASLPGSFVWWVWSIALPLRNLISNGSWSYPHSTAYTAPSTSPVITRSAFMPTSSGSSAPSATGASRDLFDSLPLEFKIRGTMKILQATGLK